MLGSRAVVGYELEFYEDERGDSPVRRWLREELTLAKRQALGYAMQIVLQHLGVAVCGTEFGRQLGGGLFEFRLRRSVEGGRREDPASRVLPRVRQQDRPAARRLRQGARPSPRLQDEEIAVARSRLATWRRR